MRLFISAGEPSGDVHGANLIRAVQARRGDVEFDGFGGERMAAAGGRLLYPLSQHATIGFLPVLRSVPFFARLLECAARFLRTNQPDALVMIDYPGFHWHLARRAHALGIPVVYFIPPQLWAWGGWRIAKMRRTVSRVLCTLPFEDKWYRQRHVRAEYVGHPYWDELYGQQLDPMFLAEQESRPGEIVGLLPGSRRQEIESNVPVLLRAAERIHSRRPDVRFLVACLRPEQARRVRELARGSHLPLEVHDGRTPEIIDLAHSCIAVSGSVSLELLFRLKPTVVLYRVNRGGMVLSWMFQKCRYISLPNLLAGKVLYPEYLTAGCPADDIAEHVLGWLNNDAAYQRLVEELRALRDWVAVPGACERAAERVLEVAGANDCRFQIADFRAPSQLKSAI
jgi:lipid-A-disaccharide synthase